MSNPAPAQLHLPRRARNPLRHPTRPALQMRAFLRGDVAELSPETLASLRSLGLAYEDSNGYLRPTEVGWRSVSSHAETAGAA